MASSAIRPVVMFGKIITSDITKGVKVCIDKYVMDKRLAMYFKEKKEVYARDKNKVCSEGDYVIIREIPESESIYLSDGIMLKYDVQKLVYKAGFFVDPVSEKKSAGHEYIDDIKRTNDLYGGEKTIVKDKQ